MEHGCPETSQMPGFADVACNDGWARWEVCDEGMAQAERSVIEYIVGQVFDVPAVELRAGSRGRAHVAQARQVAMYLAHVICQKTLSDVGRLFDRDRTTVAHACCLVEDRRDDPLFDHVIELLEGLVGAMVQPRPLSQDLAGAVLN